MRRNANASHIYEIIKSKILNCEFEPGQFISEKEIVDKLNISRTPVREALNMLEGQGLIVVIPNKGIQISTLPIRKLEQIYEIRRIIEPLSVKLAIKYMKIKDMDFLAALNERLIYNFMNDDFTEVFKLGKDIHLYIARLTDNETLYSIIKILREESLRGYIYHLEKYFNCCNKDNRKDKELKLAKIHNKLISALVEGDEEKAAGAVIEDIDEMMGLIMQA